MSRFRSNFFLFFSTLITGSKTIRGLIYLYQIGWKENVFLRVSGMWFTETKMYKVADHVSKKGQINILSMLNFSFISAQFIFIPPSLNCLVVSILPPSVKKVENSYATPSSAEIWYQTLLMLTSRESGDVIVLQKLTRWQYRYQS